MRPLLFSALPFLLLTSACTYTGTNTANAPIVMGDSATIVTETDSQYLKSAFADYETASPVASPQPETATPPKTDTPASAAPKATEVPVAAKKQTGPGLSADFGDMEVFIENLRVREGSAPAKGARSAAYASDGSVFRPKNLVVSGATAAGASLKQKTDFEVVLNTGKEMLPLPSLGRQSTGWESVSGKAGTFALSTPPEPAFKVTNAAIKNAVQQAARKAGMSSKEQTALLNRLSRVKTVDGDLLQAQATATLWQVTAKDAKGRPVTKEIRVDW